MRRAVSAVMDLRQWTISWMRIGGTQIVFASRYWVIPSSFMVSARCSPGWVGSGVVIAFLLVVVGEFDLHCAPVRPDKTDAPLVVDSDAVLPLPVPAQGFKPVGGWYAKVRERRRPGSKIMR